MSTPTAFVIAGPARCGKSTLARKLHQRIEAQWIAVDSLTKAMNVSGLSSIIGSPDVVDDTNVGTWLDSIRARDREAARFLVPMVENVISVQQHSLIVDNGMWAEDIARLSVPVRTVFVVDTGQDNGDRLRAIRDSGDRSANNWHYHRSYSDEKVQWWADLNRERGKLFAAHAEQYGYPLFDLAEYDSFDDIQDAALAVLLDGYDGGNGSVQG